MEILSHALLPFNVKSLILFYENTVKNLWQIKIQQSQSSDDTSFSLLAPVAYDTNVITN